MSITPLAGQEKIFEAIIDGDRLKTWNLVKFIGYNEVPSYQKRKLIFLQTFKDFDPEKNNNFVTYYVNKLRYASLQEWKRSNPLTNDKRAIRDNIERQLWPTQDNEEPINQNANILRKFRF